MTTQTDTPEIFQRPGQGLYAWVTLSQYKLMKWDGLDPIKFGQYGSDAENGKTPQETISSYSWVTEPIVILWAYRFNREQRRKHSALNVEKDVRNRLGATYFDGNSTEVRRTSVDTIKEEVNSYLFGSRKLNSFLLRVSQKLAVTKIVDYFTNGGKEFLLGAIMRFGKNFVFLSACKEIIGDKGNILVLTNKPGVFDSLKKDIETHVNFDGWEYYELKTVKDKDNLVLDPNKVSVVACSKQLADNIVSGESTREFLKGTDWDLSFFDECHSATETDNFTSLNAELNIKHRVWASGTPYKTAVRFTNDNSFFYGYIEQQRDKKLGLCPDAVTLITYITAINPKFINNPNYTSDEQWTISKMFAFENEKFVLGGELREFLLEVLGKADTKAKFSPMRICEGNLDHTVWLVPPDIKMTEALEKLLNEIAPEYKILNATGNNITEVKQVEDAIKLHSKTITLTNSRFVEGTTIPEWTGAFVFCDTDSVEKYFQFIFRIASPDEGKDKAYVFDFSLERTFKMVYEFANGHAHNVGRTDRKEVIREWLDCNPLYRAGNGPTFNEVNVEDVLDVINKSDYNHAYLVSKPMDYVKSLDALGLIASEFSSLNTGVKATITAKHITNGLEKGKNFTVSGKKDRQLTPKEKSELMEALKNIGGIVGSFPIMAELEQLETVEDLVDKADEALFYDCTKVSKDTFNLLLTNNILDTAKINLYL